MDYQATIDYLFNSTPLFQHLGASAYKPGLQTTYALDAHFGFPHKKYKTIHVAGTNGKGSCCHTLAAILQSAGLKVGLYTSPHLLDFRERIRINGEMISEQFVVDFVEKERPFFEPLHPSFFEITTALALHYFAVEQVDIAVVEVGLGGRLDCTNVITPLLSIITNISKDHTEFLGDTLSAIAGEKAGIIKSHIPVVIGETQPETYKVFAEKAAEMEAPITFADEQPEVLSSFLSSDGLRVYQTRNYAELKGELAGECQVKNANTILKALNILKQTEIGWWLTERDIANGFRHVCKLTGLMGRWQVLREQPKVVCDTGHNAGGWKYLNHQLRGVSGRLHIIFGMANDKAADAVIAELPENACFYWTRANTARSFSEDEIQTFARSHDRTGQVFHRVSDAYQAALKAASPEDTIFVGGSNFVVADLLSFLQKED